MAQVQRTNTDLLTQDIRASRAGPIAGLLLVVLLLGLAGLQVAHSWHSADSLQSSVTAITPHDDAE